ncbi:MAG: acyl-CoA ligase (AMP-forming), exosortase A system-associated [Sphingomonadales bacterium]|nr:acyl-CoA ligase (AMP-forming), exosortase A system-associated [Sphingomonadales bacterium]PIX66602.1 MAG: acyl-CoA ligase (AMP-forming), exosortase A system-associated [Sphingomonadales bacterium CG_4_10_14_3_um_filter_58_15]NCO48023.1 acyl-CoA ligase (AMP-forming), exosortase A system-associated [Sphingomonadales bacterium]NCP01584.1 acyl-CoA ligase (AMP-forming), exosortase A system-associated [Sphingomonadales bacterium]NCP27156.1 acyl-CoA ligase (AMP-forming), exosortase A system-associa
MGKDPDADALATRSGTLSYKMLNHRIGALAAWLQGQGVAKGDRVATWLSKTELACIMPLAAARAGLVHVPVNPLLKHAQVAYIVEDSGAKLLIGNAGRLKSLEGSDIDPDCELFEDKFVDNALESIAEPMVPSAATTDTDDLAAILYTSGSTGRPKGVMLSHANMTLGALSVAEYLKLAADDRTICVLPLSFDYGQNQLLSTWAAGGCAVPLDYLTPRDVMKACAREKITTLAAVPPLWVQLVEHEWPEEAVASMRRLTNSGGALTPTLVRQLRAIFGSGTDIYAMYGLTEAFRSTYLDPSLIDDNPTSMGTAIPFAEILVVDESGAVAGPDQAGELVHCGPLVAQGYWNDPERTAQRFKSAPDASHYRGTAVFSGDTVKRGADGLLYFVSRDDAMIKSSGNRISPTEIEEIAVESGLIAEAVALGVPDERLGHAIRLFVRPVKRGSETGAVTDQLRSYLKENLPNFMHPRDIVLLSEFPKNPNGKLDRNLLASMDVE